MLKELKYKNTLIKQLFFTKHCEISFTLYLFKLPVVIYTKKMNLSDLMLYNQDTVNYVHL